VGHAVETESLLDAEVVIPLEGQFEDATDEREEHHERNGIEKTGRSAFITTKKT
jgi:hypothetical protein